MLMHRLHPLSLFLNGLLIVLFVPLVVAPLASSTIRQGVPPVPAEMEDAPQQINLGDCLRGQPPAGWPIAYKRICMDLVTPAAGRPISQDKIISASVPKSYISRRSVGIINNSADTPCLLGKKETGALRSKNMSGIALVVPTSCRMQLPIGGTIVYADRFQGYRGVVIIDTDQGQKLIIAGLGELSVRRGERIKAGASIGRTEAELAPALRMTFGKAALTEDSGSSLVYFDLRDRTGKPLPVAWISSGN